MKDNVTIIHVPDEAITIEFNPNNITLYITQGDDYVGIDIHNVQPLQMALEYANGYVMSKVRNDAYAPASVGPDSPIFDTETAG